MEAKISSEITISKDGVSITLDTTDVAQLLIRLIEEQRISVIDYEYDRQYEIDAEVVWDTTTGLLDLPILHDHL